MRNLSHSGLTRIDFPYGDLRTECVRRLAYQNDEKKRGFTFVELLVVITIIAILTGAAMVSFTSTNRRSRDTRRRLDIENIRSALELCRTEEGSYPLSIYSGISCGGEIYLADTPEDPKSQANYAYVRSSATSYTLDCVLESGDDCSFTNP